MEDLRITGYNALLTPAFLQEELPMVSKAKIPLRRVIELNFFTVDNILFYIV
jgi:3-deoxy-7-phosphoheptulonate synthase